MYVIFIQREKAANVLFTNENVTTGIRDVLLTHGRNKEIGVSNLSYVDGFCCSVFYVLHSQGHFNGIYFFIINIIALGN